MNTNTNIHTIEYTCMQIYTGDTVSLISSWLGNQEVYKHMWTVDSTVWRGTYKFRLSLSFLPFYVTRSTECGAIHGAKIYFTLDCTSVSKNHSYLSVSVEKSNCEHLWCDHGLVWKKVSLLPVVKGELTSG